MQSVDERRECSGEEPVGRDHEPREQMEQKERARQVRQALDTLSAEHRAVLVLREIEGCSYEQMSEILESPIGTVRSRLHRARLEMRDQLKRVLQEDLA
jgi:RNA polymerase sigma-70 factor (ECF subfamily)